ncbi:hypothetical protein [Streptomyces sp. NPDC091278]|uniref:hypothetical protein n=1 Tax=Streptomyces sp. NPDC091278 TaxID=3155301 RepID=UPI00344CBD4D
MAPIEPTWFIPYIETSTGGAIVLDPIQVDADQHDTLVINLLTHTISHVEVTAATEAEALRLGTQKITELVKTDDSDAAEPATPQAPAGPPDPPHHMPHPLGGLPFAKTALALFHADHESHVLALTGVSRFLDIAHAFCKDQDLDKVQYTNTFTTPQLVGVYLQHLLIINGMAHDAIEPMTTLIAPLNPVIQMVEIRESAAACLPDPK